MEDLPERIRASLGTAIVLGLLDGKLDAAPTTAYLMTYREGKCSANCGFCPQARESGGRADMLSRVSWPVFPTARVLNGIHERAKQGSVRRVCIQTLNYPKAMEHLQALVRAIRNESKAAVSVSCQPQNGLNIRRLADAGAERIGIPLDAATKDLFDKVKGVSAGGPYDWEGQFELLREAVEVFGRGKVSTHLIVELGETEKDMLNTVQRCVDMGVLPALFAFTPILGTALERRPQPSVQKYRRIQIARNLIVHGTARFENMCFDAEGRLTGFGVDPSELTRSVETGKPFVTSGCPDCNRPYYNEKPSGPIYNYPRTPTKSEIDEALRDLGIDEA